MAPTHRVSAVIFDLDGTLLDTERATRDVLKEFLGTYGKVPDPAKEEKRLGQMNRESTTGIIADYGLPLTVDEYSEAIYPLYMERWQRANPLPGVKRLLKHLHKNGVPLALASNSIRRNIDHKILKLGELKDCFSVVLGGDQVPHGKPCPDIFLEAAKRLGVNPSSCLVIEDSLVGVQAAKASGAKVVAVPSLQSQRQCYSIADLILYSLLDFHPELWGLPPFEDCIKGALPMEPLLSNAHIGDVVTNNTHTIVAGERTYDSIPDQISGIFLCWAKSEAYGVSKAVVSIGWDLSLQNVERVMRICFLDSLCKAKTEDPVELLLIGYVRMLESTQKAQPWMERTKPLPTASTTSSAASINDLIYAGGRHFLSPIVLFSFSATDSNFQSTQHKSPCVRPAAEQATSYAYRKQRHAGRQPGAEVGRCPGQGLRLLVW